MSINLSPRKDWVVVKSDAEETTTSGGIVLAPSTNKEKPQRGMVVAVGPGKKLDDGTLVAMDIKVGDHVLYGKYSGSEFKLDKEDYMMLREDDIMAIIKS